MSRVLQKAFQARMESDYDYFIEYETDEVKQRFEELKYTVKEIENFLLRNQLKSRGF